MSKETYEELMWQDIDGTISPEDRERLQKYLNGDPEARELFEELSRFTRVLGDVEEVDPPSDLHESITRALSRIDRHETDGIVAAIRGFFGSTRHRRLAFATAAGFIVGIIGYHFIGNELRRGAQLDPAYLYGTVDFGTDNDGWLDISLDGVNGTVKLRRDKSFVLSELDLTSDRPVRVEMLYPGESLFRYGGIERSDEKSNLVTIRSDGITLTNAGAGKYFLILEVLDKGSAPVIVRILSDENILWESSVHPDKIPSVN